MTREEVMERLDHIPDAGKLACALAFMEAINE